MKKLFLKAVTARANVHFRTIHVSPKGYYKTLANRKGFTAVKGIEEKSHRVEQIKKQEDVKKALEQTTNKGIKKHAVKTKHKFFVGSYLLLLLCFATLFLKSGHILE